jgi:hypothetical protein
MLRHLECDLPLALFLMKGSRVWIRFARRGPEEFKTGRPAGGQAAGERATKPPMKGKS